MPGRIPGGAPAHTGFARGQLAGCQSNFKVLRPGTPEPLLGSARIAPNRGDYLHGGRIPIEKLHSE